MANEYASVSNLKLWLGISGSDQDTILAIVAEAASRAIDRYCHRRFYADGTETARIYTPNGQWVQVDDIANNSSLSVAADHNRDGVYEQTWTEDDEDGYGFRLEPLNADKKTEPWDRLTALYNPWPQRNGSVKVTADWGWPAVPADVEQAALIQAGAIWTSSGQLQETAGVPGIQSLQLEGSDRVEWASASSVMGAAMRLSEMAKELLADYRRDFLVL